MLEDPELLGQIKIAIQDELINAEAALFDASEKYACMLEGFDDVYFRARALDIQDVARRVLEILLTISRSPVEDLEIPSIIIAQDLSPSDTVLINKKYILGFCTAEGGATSHTAILARGVGIPAIVGVGINGLTYPNGATLILDGNSGLLIVDPDNEIQAEYQEKQKHLGTVYAQAREQANEPAVTKDGHHVEVVANIGRFDDARITLDAGAEGVGLLRSEFLYLERDSLPDEEEQYQAYKAIADAFEQRPVILRTLDIGGDKELPYLDIPQEANPFLGVRAIRLCLDQPELFRPQLRAALRAGHRNNLKLMFPMISSLDELPRAKALLNECRQELLDQGQALVESIEVGIMIEIPAAALMADQFADEVYFFSIGTNDLTQYTLAADRANAHVAEIASGFQLAVFRLINQVIEAAHACGKESDCAVRWQESRRLFQFC